MSSPSPYHHGHLRAALLETAYRAAAHGGPQALVVRDLARALGVSPAASYHHFKDREHLVAAVAQRAREAMATEMITARKLVPENLAPAPRSVRRLAAVGHAYLDFGRREPALLRIAFGPCTARPDRPDDPGAWQILVDALDEVADTGAIEAAQRPGAELIVWSAVHGLSVLRNDGAVPPDSPTNTDDQIVIRGALSAVGCHLTD